LKLCRSLGFERAVYVREAGGAIFMTCMLGAEATTSE